MKKLRLKLQNKHLEYLSINEITCININSLNGVKRGVSNYNKYGRKINTSYYSIFTGKLLVKKEFTDIIDDVGVITGILMRIKWFFEDDTYFEKNVLLEHSSFEIYKLKIKRRKNILDYLLYQNSLITDATIKIASDYIFNYLSNALTSWVNSGDNTELLTLLKDTSNPSVISNLNINIKTSLTLKAYLLNYI